MELEGDAQGAGHGLDGSGMIGRGAERKKATPTPSGEASHESWNQGDVRPRDESEGEASQDRGEGVRCRSIEGTDLREKDRHCSVHAMSIPETWSPWESCGSGLGGSLSSSLYSGRCA